MKLLTDAIADNYVGYPFGIKYFICFELTQMAIGGGVGVYIGVNYPAEVLAYVGVKL